MPEEKIIISLDFETDDFVASAAKLNGEIAELNANQRALKKSGEAGSIQFQKNSQALKENKQELNETNKVINNLTKANKANAGSNEQLKAQLSVLTLEFNKLSKAERENGARGKELSKSINQVTGDLKSNEKAIQNNRRNVGNYEDGIGDAGLGLKEFATGLVGVTAILGAASAALDFMVGSFKEANEAMKTSNQLFNESEENIEELTSTALALANTFDKDVNDVLLSAAALSSEFGISGVEAAKLVEDGFLKGADANGEFLDTLKEYPAQLKAVGLSAEESIAVITQANQSGVFSDKGIDAIKEAGLRLREFTPATEDAIDAIGLSGNEIQKQIEDGTLTLFEATQKISNRISELPAESNEVGTAIADIFGGAGEDAGLRFVTGIGAINTELGELDVKVDELDQANLELSKTWNSLAVEGSNLNGVLGSVVGAANELLTGFSDLFELDYGALFDTENAENSAAAWKDLGNSLLTVYAPGIALATDTTRINEKALEALTGKLSNYTAEQLNNDKAAKVVIENLKKTGLTTDEATEKYQALITAQAAETVEEEKNTASAEDNAKARAAATKALDNEIKKSKELLSLFITEQGTRAKTLEEKLAISKQVSEKELAILQQELDAKKISQTKFEEESLKIKQEYLLQQTEITIANAERELEIVKSLNDKKLEEDKFFSEEKYNQELALNDARFQAERDFQALKLEQGTIDQQQYNDAINAINEENLIANQELAAERKEAEDEQLLIDLENQREIDLANGENEFQLRQEDLDRQKAQELKNAESTGADKALIEAKFAKFEKDLEDEKRNAQVSAASDAFGAIAVLAGDNAEAAKGIAIAQALINAYQGITSVLAAQSVIPEPFGSALKAVSAAAIGVTAFNNVQKIRSTQVPKAAKGGIFGGKPHSQGGTRGKFSDGTEIEVEKGELFAVVNKNSTDVLSNLSNLNEAGGGIPFFERGGIQTFQDGGIGLSGVTASVEASVDSANQILDVVDSLPSPVVAVQDINEVQDETNQVEVRALV